MADHKYKRRVIGTVWVNRDEYGDEWCYEHTATGNSTACDSQEDAQELLEEDHEEYLAELKDRAARLRGELEEWKDHLK